MIEFILNNQDIKTDLPPGTTVLDFVRYHKNLKGTKIGCREGDCGACTVLVGELIDEKVNYRTMTSCLMPLANAQGKHIVSIEGINPENGDLTPVQRAMIDESGTQCGFCTVGFVMSLTGFCLDDFSSPHVNKGSTEAAISSIDGNICRCTGYKSIERAAAIVSSQMSDVSFQPDGSEPPAVLGGLSWAIKSQIIPKYFFDVPSRLKVILESPTLRDAELSHPLPQAVLTKQQIFVSGGTDVYVQKPDDLPYSSANHLFYNEELQGIRDTGDFIEFGASATVTDLLVSPVMQDIFPDLYKHLKLVSSTPIRNMATLAGNFINASPIGDMTVWFLALDAEIVLCSSPNSPPGLRRGGRVSRTGWSGGVAAVSADGVVLRTLPLKDFYLGYKQLAKTEDEFIKTIRFKKPAANFRFNFEKVCKRTYLDIATVNTAISLKCDSTPGEGWLPPVLSEPGAVATGFHRDLVHHVIIEAHVSAGGVAPIPLYLKETSAFLKGKDVNEETIAQANEIMQAEISPISDIRGTEEYKRLLLRQLFHAHFVELFNF